MGRKGSSKERIAQCFVQLVIESSNPRERVSVTEIVKTLGMDRKNFYRHFENTTDLVIWIFRSELAETLHGEAFEGFQLEYPDPALYDSYPDLPFFARSCSEGQGLDPSRYTKSLVALFNGKSEYYQRILTYPCYLDFYYYLISLFQPATRKSILQLLGDGRIMSDAEIDFLAEYHTVAYIGRLPLHYVMKRQALPEEGLEGLWTYTNDVLHDSIERLARPIG